MKKLNLRKKLIRQDCDMYQSCPAYVCPIDPCWNKVRYTEGDPICILLLCMSKPGGVQIAVDHIPGLNPKRFHDFCEKVIERHWLIKKRFEQVANTPFWYMEKQLEEDKLWRRLKHKGNDIQL